MVFSALLPCSRRACGAQYSDVRRLLLDSAISYGANVRPQARIASIEFSDDGRPSVRLASGEVIEADAVVGADGPDSAVRKEIVSPGQDVKEKTLGMSIFRCAAGTVLSLVAAWLTDFRSIPVPREAIEQDPELRPLLEQTVRDSRVLICLGTS